MHPAGAGFPQRGGIEVASARGICLGERLPVLAGRRMEWVLDSEPQEARDIGALVAAADNVFEEKLGHGVRDGVVGERTK